jgi:hypothetical protein
VPRTSPGSRVLATTGAFFALSVILVHGLVKAGAIVSDFDKTANGIVQDDAGNLIQLSGGK